MSSCPFANTQYGCGGGPSTTSYGCGGMSYGGVGSDGKKKKKRSGISRGSTSIRKARAEAFNEIVERKYRLSRRRTVTKKTQLKKKKKVAASPSKKKSPVYLRPHSISKSAKKYCGCVAKTAAKQSRECLAHIASGKPAQEFPGGNCYNPEALCGKMRPRGFKGCATLYDYKNTDKSVLEGFAALKGKSIKELIKTAAAEINELKKKRR